MADWVTTFAASQTPPIVPGGKGHTIRIIIPANVGGNALRLRFANNGEETGLIDHVTIAKCDGMGNLIKSTCRQITFHGQRNVKIVAGEEKVSDRTELSISVEEFLAVSIYCEESVKSQAGLTGFVAEAKMAGDFTETDFERKKLPKWLPVLLSQFPIDAIPYLTAVDIETDSNPVVLCCFGDSVTAQSRWFIPLQKKLYKKYPGKIIMLNAGICGNRLLGETPGKMGASFGKAGIRRIYKDVYEHCGITHILAAIGTNDLILPESKKDEQNCIPTVEEYREGYRKIKKESKDRGIKLLAFSVYPAVADKNREKIRQGYNKVISEEMGDCYININEILSNEDGNGYKKDTVSGIRFI